MTLSILIVTGQSGSGKSTVIRTLEDHGFFCVDNIPTGLVEQLINVAHGGGTNESLAVVMDVREAHFVAQAPALIERLRVGPHPVRLLYLEASEPALIRRYSETRRRHPLDRGAGLRAAISSEREILAPLRELADATLETSAMSPHELRDRVIKQVVGIRPGDSLRIGLMSFGFKHGLPLEADMVLDVRFLANPYFDPTLRHLTGLDEAVKQAVVGSEEGKMFLERASTLLGFLIPRYQREGKRYLTLAVGCTGGRHRSVAIVQALAKQLGEGGIAVDLRHRDIEE